MAQSSSGAPDEPEPQVAAVLRANSRLYAAAEHGDLDLMGEVWADGPLAESVECVHPGWPPVRGREAVLRSWALIMANSAYLEYILTDVRVEIAGDMGIVVCVEDILTNPHERAANASAPANDPLAGGRASAINVFRRLDNTWRLWLHHSAVVNSALS